MRGCVQRDYDGADLNALHDSDSSRAVGAVRDPKGACLGERRICGCRRTDACRRRRLSLPYGVMPTDILAALDADCGPDVAHAFSALAVEYLAATRDPSSRVSTSHSRTELAARFDE